MYSRVICRPCQAAKAEEVSHICVECKEYLCEACANSHKKMQITKAHEISKAEISKLTLLNQRLRRNVGSYCSCDHRQQVAFYCENGDDVICSSCKSQKHRKCVKHFIALKQKEITDKKEQKIPEYKRKQKKTIKTRHSYKLDSKDMIGVDGVNIRDMKSRENLEKAHIRESISEECGQEANQHLQLVVTPVPLNVTTPQMEIQPLQAPLSSKSRHSFGSVNIALPGETQLTWLTSICLMPDGAVVLADYFNRAIKVLEKDSLKIRDRLEVAGTVRDMATVDNANTIVTLFRLMKLQYVQVLPTMKAGRSIHLGKHCCGVAVLNDEIYTSLLSSRGEGEIRILDLDGNLRRRIGVDEDGTYTNMFIQPGHLSVSQSDGKIFVSEHASSTVMCLTGEGDVVYRYNDDDLQRLQGLFVDEDNNVCACGLDSHTVQLISKDGAKLKTLVSHKEGLRNPCSVAFRQGDSTLIVGCQRSDQLWFFNFIN